MIKALIFGATGYTGLELIRILSSHPLVVIAAGSSRKWAGKHASEVIPAIGAERDFYLRTIEELVKEPNGDVAFLALPHGESAALVRPLLNAGLKVIDLSADLRLNDAEVYQSWYGTLCNDPELLCEAVYGLPEINRDRIKAASVVANPGCYPSTVILGLAPVLSSPGIDTTCPIVDSKSGVSGAGRGAKLTTSFCEAGEGFKPYGVIRHRHIPEMEQELSKIAGRQVKVRFTPHLIPISRGMVSTIYLPVTKDVEAAGLRAIFEDFYKSEPFVRILGPGKFPDTVHVRGSNQCHISVEVDERTGWAIIMVAIDNLVKGASGVAVQNMNLMTGIDETAGLMQLPLFP
jgi:N-acetyl-gamma-glutamyl-phosphate reductase